MNQSERCKERYSKLKNLGLCVKCKQPSDLTLCQVCRDKKNARRKQRVNNGLCEWCGSIVGNKITKSGKHAGCNRTICDKCVLKQRASYYKLKPSDLIKLFEKQNYTCSYSGEKLTIENAELDHVIPKSKSGTNTIDNLQWTANWVNQMKKDFSEIEFLEKIEKILNYRRNYA